MDAIKSPKNELERVDESNFGHTKDEWGKQKDPPKIRIIEAYEFGQLTDIGMKQKYGYTIYEVRRKS